MTTTNLILICIATGFLIFTIWNALSMHSFRKRSFKNADQLNDSKYWELKTKQEFLIAMFTLISAVGAYIGINTIQSTKAELKRTFEKQIDSAKTKITDQVVPISKQIDSEKTVVAVLKSEIKKTDNKFLTYKGAFNSLTQRQKEISAKAQLSNKQFDNVLQQVTKLESKDILNQNIYVVRYYGYHFGLDTISFKDLTTIGGKHLPQFSKTPIVVPVSGVALGIRRLTKSSFVLVDVGATAIKTEELIGNRFLPVTFIIYETR